MGDINSFPVDPNSPIFVAKAILATTIAGGTAGATLGVIRSANPFAFSINMGVNGGIMGLTFFGLREYLISPLLLSASPTLSHARRFHQLSEKQLGKLPSSPSPEAASISEMRTERFLDSGISGSLAGGVLSGATRGIRTVIPAAITTGLIALAGQAVVNQVRVGRLKLLARRVGDMDGTAPQGQGEMVSTIDALDNPTAPTTAASLPGRIMKGLSHALPIRQLSDEEYLATLEKKKRDVAKRLGEIEVEELRLYEASQTGMAGTK
ncbi:uncharacterized protein MKK02DRAFT_21475 [Dioszegia hungarica]|uniref:Uncharacterized protein n=1 Tax=Dioszegia hungarica TaxID=4972 RepID=A0AA38H418_9TREE|nr:uncharacterized protein MKK02DRAFT_21475 [Dioszegia hungarica]KAI9631944.1 hypothetical protein MKK02DRAFT_21475 [Dioszegia hungarica]